MNRPESERVLAKLQVNTRKDRDVIMEVARWLRAEAYYIEDHAGELSKKYIARLLPKEAIRKIRSL